MEGKYTYQKITVHYNVPENADFVCYFHGSQKMSEEFFAALGQKQTGFLAIEGEDWNRDLSPWAAPAVFRQAGDFGGRAAEYLSFLYKTVIPQTEQALGLEVRRRGLMGYSLAGLFAVYAMFETDIFTDIASISGSLWYDGFIEYIKGRELKHKPGKVYLSLGNKEKNTKNPRMARVGDCTLEVQKYLREMGINCVFEHNPGNHFYQEKERMQKAAEWLCGLP